MKIILSSFIALALCLSGLLHAQSTGTTTPPSTNLVESPAPPPHATATITESQFATLLNAAPSNAVTGASTTIQSLQFFGTHLTLSGVPSGGITDVKQVALTSGQVTTFLAGLPALPSGEVAANIRSLSAFRVSSGISLFVQFSR